MPTQTYFAPAERADDLLLTTEIENIGNSPIITSLLTAVNGLLAVLDEHRQILAVNDTLLETFGIDDPAKVLGLRPGEIINCIHAHEAPNGCGTTPHCQTCGAAIAIVTSLASNQPSERICVAQVERNGDQEDLFLKVKAHPMTIDNQRFILLFLQDFSAEQHWRTMERVFFHDVNNLLSGLLAASELLHDEKKDVMRQKLADHIRRMSKRLAQEVALQRVLCGAKPGACQINLEPLTASRIVLELKSGFATHPAAHGKSLIFTEGGQAATITTDLHLLLKILTNMLVNALEASAAGDEVRFSVKHDTNRMIFSAWNRQVIPADIALRIFQKNFSTKADTGRGLGTYSMKLFGEYFLKGKVAFTSTDEKGTTFRISLPLTT